MTSKDDLFTGEALKRSVDVFFSELAWHLDMEVSDSGQLDPERPFAGPTGLLCRVQMRNDEDGLSARPEVTLPVRFDDLARAQVAEMLALQQVLVNELDWLLGLSSDGMLNVRPLRWKAAARDVAAELDVGNAVGHMVLDALLAKQPGKTSDPPGGPAAND